MPTKWLLLLFWTRGGKGDGEALGGKEEEEVGGANKSTEVVGGDEEEEEAEAGKKGPSAIAGSREWTR